MHKAQKLHTHKKREKKKKKKHIPKKIWEKEKEKKKGNLPVELLKAGER